LSTIASFGFWSFVGIVAGIYTLFALGVQVQFGFAGLLNFGQVAFMGIGAYTMAILVVKEEVNMWLAAGCGIGLAMLAALLLGLPTLRLRADYFAITTIAFSEILRYVATNEDRLTGGSQGTINLAGIGKASQYDGAWQSFLDKVARNLHVSYCRSRLLEDSHAADLFDAPNARFHFAPRPLPSVQFHQSVISGMRRIRESVNTSLSSRLVLENSETMAPSGPAWNQCRVLGGMVYCSPGFRIIS
jgi:branched-subunit amino acid ABC-type transport system permease component